MSWRNIQLENYTYDAHDPNNPILRPTGVGRQNIFYILEQENEKGFWVGDGSQGFMGDSGHYAVRKALGSGRRTGKSKGERAVADKVASNPSEGATRSGSRDRNAGALCQTPISHTPWPIRAEAAVRLLKAHLKITRRRNSA